MGTWSHQVNECSPWYTIVCATVTVHQFLCNLHTNISTVIERCQVRLWISNLEHLGKADDLK